MTSPAFPQADNKNFVYIPFKVQRSGPRAVQVASKQEAKEGRPIGLLVPRESLSFLQKKAQTRPSWTGIRLGPATGACNRSLPAWSTWRLTEKSAARRVAYRCTVHLGKFSPTVVRHTTDDRVLKANQTVKPNENEPFAGLMGTTACVSPESGIDCDDIASPAGPDDAEPCGIDSVTEVGAEVEIPKFSYDEETCALAMRNSHVSVETQENDSLKVKFLAILGLTSVVSYREYDARECGDQFKRRLRKRVHGKAFASSCQSESVGKRRNASKFRNQGEASRAMHVASQGLQRALNAATGSPGLPITRAHEKLVAVKDCKILGQVKTETGFASYQKGSSNSSRELFPAVGKVHNHLERERRRAQRNAFRRLREAMPQFSDFATDKVPKVRLLLEARKYCRTLAATEKELMLEKAHLLAHNCRLLRATGGKALSPQTKDYERPGGTLLSARKSYTTLLDHSYSWPPRLECFVPNARNTEKDDKSLDSSVNSLSAIEDSDVDVVGLDTSHGPPKEPNTERGKVEDDEIDFSLRIVSVRSLVDKACENRITEKTTKVVSSGGIAQSTQDHSETPNRNLNGILPRCSRLVMRKIKTAEGGSLKRILVIDTDYKIAEPLPPYVLDPPVKQQKIHMPYASKEEMRSRAKDSRIRLSAALKSDAKIQSSRYTCSTSAAKREVNRLNNTQKRGYGNCVFDVSKRDACHESRPSVVLPSKAGFKSVPNRESKVVSKGIGTASGVRIDVNKGHFNDVTCKKTEWPEEGSLSDTNRTKKSHHATSSLEKKLPTVMLERLKLPANSVTIQTTPSQATNNTFTRPAFRDNLEDDELVEIGEPSYYDSSLPGVSSSEIADNSSSSCITKSPVKEVRSKMPVDKIAKLREKLRQKEADLDRIRKSMISLDDIPLG